MDMQEIVERLPVNYFLRHSTENLWEVLSEELNSVGDFFVAEHSSGTSAEAALNSFAENCFAPYSINYVRDVNNKWTKFQITQAGKLVFESWVSNWETVVVFSYIANINDTHTKFDVEAMRQQQADYIN